MTTLAGRKIRRHREAHRPKMGRPSFGALYGVSASTLQGWEEEGKRPDNPDIVNRMAKECIATHADWYRPALCPRCETESDATTAASCTIAECPLAVRQVA